MESQRRHPKKRVLRNNGILSAQTLQASRSPATPLSVPRLPAQPPHPEWSQVQNDQDTPLPLEAEDDNPHILGPAVTGDSHVLVGYLSSVSGGQGMREIRLVRQ